MYKNLLVDPLTHRFSLPPLLERLGGGYLFLGDGRGLTLFGRWEGAYKKQADLQDCCVS